MGISKDCVLLFSPAGPEVSLREALLLVWNLRRMPQCVDAVCVCCDSVGVHVVVYQHSQATPTHGAACASGHADMQTLLLLYRSVSLHNTILA